MKKNLMDCMWSSFKMALPETVFESMIHSNTTWGELRTIMRSFNSMRNAFLTTDYCVDSFVIYSKKNFFKFMIEDSKFYIWDNDDKSLGYYWITHGYDYLNEVPTKEFCDWVKEIITTYDNGKIHCADCGKLIENNNLGRRYFAGVYCEDCWQKKWKDIEAKEDYN